MSRYWSTIFGAVFVLIVIGVWVLAVMLLQRASAPDYTKAEQWYTHRNDSATADIFYICSTETADWVNSQGDTMHFADLTRPDHRAALYSEMRGVDSLLTAVSDQQSAGSGQQAFQISNHKSEICNHKFNFYSPYYRQATMEGLLRDTALFRVRCAKATEDIVRAFDHYIGQENNGRPFVLMGYSQGAYAVVALLKRMQPEVAERMIAAYVIGYQVTEADLLCPTIRPAQGADDRGVTVCFNSVSSPDGAIAVLSGQTAIGINPVNWRTDAEPARYIYRFGGACDTLTATLDTLTHLTRIDGLSTPCPVLPIVGNEENYHCLEIPLYYEALRENIELRSSEE